MKNIIIATIKNRNIENAFKLKKMLASEYTIHIVTEKEKLTYDFLQKNNPEYVFFPHWSWIIPENISNSYNCVIFHTSKLPFGRGGSPIQNQIIRGIKESQICALQCVKSIDAGDVYLREDIDLGKGSADEILREISDKIFFRMIPEILNSAPIPVKQDGVPVMFKRRTPEESSIRQQELNTIYQIYDFIRMLDGEGYPKAFWDNENIRFSFSNAVLRNGKLEANVEIYEKQDINSSSSS